MAEGAGSLGALSDRLRADVAVGSIAPGATVAVAVAGQAPVLAALASQGDGAMVLAVAPTTIDAERLARDLECFLGSSTAGAVGAMDGPVVSLPAWDTLPFERVSPEIAAMGARHAARWRVAEGARPRVVVASVRALMQ